MVWTAEQIRQTLRHARLQSARRVISREGLIPSAVLVPLVSVGTTTQLLLTQRTNTVETHKGHIAFPGGMVDEDDRDRCATALREVREELGITADAIETIDLLDDLATPTGFIITPVVGFLHVMPHIDPNPAEVADVFLVPFSFLETPANCRRETRLTEFGPRETWQYDYEGRIIWGATAAIIHELMTILYPPLH
jgi:8-oxo-dGTP pyrophosphatase MutT (NUDIX family)